MAEPEPEAEQTPPSSENPLSAEAVSKSEVFNPNPEQSGQVEPVPEWSRATVEWGVAWDLHLYGLGALFGIIAFQGIFSIVRYRRNSRHKIVHIINFSLLTCFGLSRALFLVIDGYHSKNLLPAAAVKMLWGVGQPCIVTAYTLMFVVLKNVLMMRQRFRSWYNTRNIALTTLPYFAFVCVAEMTVAFIPSLKTFTFVCQFLYVFFTLLLLLFYSFIAQILWKKKQTVKSGMEGFGRKEHGSRLRSILLVCFMAIVGGMALFILQLYAMFGVYGVFSAAHAVPPWPWYIFNTAQRLLELYMSAILIWILSYKPRVSSNDNSQNTSTVREKPPELNSDIVVKRHLKRKERRTNETTKELNFPGSSLTLEPL